MQGGHHVAQKFSTSSFPPKLEFRRCGHYPQVMEKSGAESPTTPLSWNESKMTYTNTQNRR